MWGPHSHLVGRGENGVCWAGAFARKWWAKCPSAPKWSTEKGSSMMPEELSEGRDCWVFELVTCCKVVCSDRLLGKVGLIAEQAGCRSDTRSPDQQ